MSKEEYRQAADLLRKISAAHGFTGKKGMEFSKKIIIFASVLCAGTWVVAAISWFLMGEFPTELTRYTMWFYGAAIAFYMGKTGYENKAKIQNTKGEIEKWEN